MAEKPVTEKTEPPTQKRLQKARDEGHLPQAMELGSVVGLFVLLISVTLAAPAFGKWVIELLEEGLSCQRGAFANAGAFTEFAKVKTTDMLMLILPILAALVAAAIGAGLVVVGANFAPAAMKLKFNAINPVEGFSNLITTKSLVKLLVSIAKLLFISLIVWLYLYSNAEQLMRLRWAWSAEILSVTGRIVFGLCIRVCIALLVIAVADTMYQKWRYIEDLKMTKQEVKQERRDTDGSPEVKGRIRRIQLQMTMKRMLADVPKASVVLVNPTHYAVALKYDAKEMDAPMMVAKGADEIAFRIMEVARSYGIPVVRRPELARTIYATVRIGQLIPRELYVAVAEVLAMLHRLRKKR